MHHLFILFIIILLSASSCTSSTHIFNQYDIFRSSWRQVWKSPSTTEIAVETNIQETNRTIWIITTASLPWMTGTSVNPLLRAVHLARDHLPGKVHLLIPWLGKHDQNMAFRNPIRFNAPAEQVEYIRDWLVNEAEIPAEDVNSLEISFYPATYHDEFHSIFPLGDISSLIPEDQADICILEEPEHLNWYKAPFTAKAWMDKFKFVLGIIHTNYIMYSRAHALGQLRTPLLYFINQAVCRAYCHKVIKLSDALQEFAPDKEIVCNVHGVRKKFLKSGLHYLHPKRGAYFIGKLAWQKGLGELFALSSYSRGRAKSCVPIDIYGDGPHAKDIREAAQSTSLPLSFYGPLDHAMLSDYRVFVNPSISEVLCTAIAEAVAMNKWVVCAKHPSNEFFEQFPNCLLFSDEEEFLANLMWSTHHDAVPLSDSQRRVLSWEAANDRLTKAAQMTAQQFVKSKAFGDVLLARLFQSLGTGSRGDAFRQLAGGKVAAHQMQFNYKLGSTPLLK